MWKAYLAICLPLRIKKRPIDGRSEKKGWSDESLKCQPDLDQTI